jgi:hypothetical protein
MLQIIHDIAPKAKLAFRTGFITAGDMAKGIRDLRDAGCKVIVDDITMITEPFFKDGQVSSAVTDVVNSGTAYFTSAGNFGNNSTEGVFTSASTAVPAGIIGTAHDFGNGDIYQKITLVPGTYTIVLQWEDLFYSNSELPGAANDLDLYLVSNDGTQRYGFNRINSSADPYEFLPITVTQTTQTNLLVIRAAGSANVRFKIIAFRGNIKFDEYQAGKSTIVAHANNPKAFSIGAALYTNTPPYGVATPTIASFSSRGGLVINGINPQKPDFVAPNGGNTTVNFGVPFNDGDNFPNFFGTAVCNWLEFT